MAFIGVGFSSLDPRSVFDDEEKKLIKQYGGKI